LPDENLLRNKSYFDIQPWNSRNNLKTIDESENYKNIQSISGKKYS